MSIDLSLARVRLLLEHFTYTRPTVHIVGTNGKGSTSALLASIFRASSYFVGRFNSPHLVAVHDCISLNNTPISVGKYSAIRQKVEDYNTTKNIKATSFEILTVTALQAFEREQVDIVILEAGLGGRLDATNAIADECVIASALTAVDLDHQTFLGDTPAAIAREKAAIARKGRPFVIGAQFHASAREAAAEVILAHGAVARPPVIVELRSSSTPFRSEGQAVSLLMSAYPTRIECILPLHGLHQLENLGTVAGIVDSLLVAETCPDPFGLLQLRKRITPETIASGIECTRWPGRLSYHTLEVKNDSDHDPLELRILADGAHNPASAATLGRYINSVLLSLATTSKRVHLTYILALSHSPPKTPLQTLEPILPPKAPENLEVDIDIAMLRFTPPEGMPWVKPVPPSILRDTVSSLVPNAVLYTEQDDEASNHEQLNRVLRWTREQHKNTGPESLIILAGSLYLVADLYRIIEAGIHQ